MQLKGYILYVAVASKDETEPTGWTTSTPQTLTLVDSQVVEHDQQVIPILNPVQIIHQERQVLFYESCPRMMREFSVEDDSVGYDEDDIKCVCEVHCENYTVTTQEMLYIAKIIHTINEQNPFPDEYWDRAHDLHTTEICTESLHSFGMHYKYKLTGEDYFNCCSTKYPPVVWTNWSAFDSLLWLLYEEAKMEEYWFRTTNHVLLALAIIPISLGLIGKSCGIYDNKNIN